jgi:hypothetical protein
MCLQRGEGATSSEMAEETSWRPTIIKETCEKRNDLKKGNPSLEATKSRLGEVY